MDTKLIEVLLGLLLTYALLSLLATTVQELLVAGFFQTRGRHLVKGLNCFLSGADTEKPRKKLLAYIRDWGKRKRKPRANLADALLDTALLKRLRKGSRYPSYVPGDMLTMALLHHFQPNYRDVSPAVFTAELKSKHAELATLFESILPGVEKDWGAFEKRIEVVYDQAMERVSGWYKRSTQIWLGVLGFILAMLLNIDSIALTKKLWVSPQTRENIVAQVSSAHQIHNPSSQEDLRDQLARRLQDVENLGGLGLPIGWAGTAYSSAMQWFWAIVGWLITAIAVSLGAPFWFDLMSKAVTLRASGKRPAESQPTLKAENR